MVKELIHILTQAALLVLLPVEDIAGLEHTIDVRLCIPASLEMCPCGEWVQWGEIMVSFVCPLMALPSL